MEMQMVEAEDLTTRRTLPAQDGWKTTKKMYIVVAIIMTLVVVVYRHYEGVDKHWIHSHLYSAAY